MYEITFAKQVLEAFEFENEEIKALIEMKKKAGHLLLCENGNTVSVTPSDVDYYAYIIRNEKNKDIIDEVMAEIENLLSKGYIKDV